MRKCLGTVAALYLFAVTGCATARPLVSGSASAPDEPTAVGPAPAPVVAPPVVPDEARSAAWTVPPSACPCAPKACAPICRLPCEDGIASWHLRALGGYGTWVGEDAGNPCSYFGGDIGYTWCGTRCGCWGLDGFYRTHSATFDRDPAGEDGGYIHHVGVKLTYERSLGGRFFAWGGVGPEYFWTSDYLDDDSGFGVFGEAGIGYLFSCTLRARLGVNVHAINTDVGRQSPADDGESRWLFLIAPVVGLEIDF